MIQITPLTRVLVAIKPVDFRKGIEGLAGLCRQLTQTHPMSGTLFVFRSRRGNSIKILGYDGQGYWLCQKRLSTGRFKKWPQGDSPTLVLDPHQFSALIWNGNPMSAQTAPHWRPLVA